MTFLTNFYVDLPCQIYKKSHKNVRHLQHMSLWRCVEYFLGGKGGRYVELTPLPPSSADCHEIWGPRPPGTLTACPGLYMDCCTFRALYVVFALE
jgi:hypothetical protein